MRISERLVNAACDCGNLLLNYVVDPLLMRIHSCFERIRPLFYAPTNYTQLKMPPHPIVNTYPREHKSRPWPRYLDDSCYVQYPYADRSGLVPENKMKLAEPKELVTPLHVSSGADNTTGMTRFLARGAEVDPQDIRGQTPAYWAAYFGKVHALTLLTIYSANLNHVDKRGKTLMRAAVKYDRIQAIDYLVSHGVNVHTKDERKLSPIQLAAYRGNFRAYEKLVYYGANEEEKDLSGRSTREILEAKCQEIYCNRPFFMQWFSRPEPQFTLRPNIRQQLKERLSR